MDALLASALLSPSPKMAVIQNTVPIEAASKGTPVKKYFLMDDKTKKAFIGVVDIVYINDSFVKLAVIHFPEDGTYDVLPVVAPPA